jgi:hypothetical protein
MTAGERDAAHEGEDVVSNVRPGGGGGRESNPPATRSAAHWF